MAKGRFALDLSTTAFVFLGASLAIFASSKALGIASISMVAPLAAIVAVVAVNFGPGSTSRLSGKDRAVNAGAFLALLTFSVWAGNLFYDTSFDGRWYHQESQIRLLSGFDPFRESVDQDSLEGGVWSIRQTGKEMASPGLWVNHYPKAQEIVGASMASLTGDIESAKFQNILLWISLGLLGYGVAARTPGATRRTGLVVALVLGSNPVVLGQLWTNYNDGVLFGYLGGTIGFLALHHLEGRRSWLVCAGIVAACLANVKFTGMVYATILLGIHSGWILLRRGHREAISASAVAGGLLALGILGIGYNPYVRNTLEMGHPLHPIMGPRAVDIMSINSAPDFQAMGRIRRFVEASLGSTSSILPDHGGVPIKVPFAIDLDQLRATASPDPRVAGFGPFFAPLFYLALAIWVWSLVGRIREFLPRWRAGTPRPSWDTFALDCAMAALLLTSIVNPEFWWARYVPQLWLVPLVGWLALRRPGMSPWALPGCLPLAQVLTGALVLGMAVFGSIRSSLVVERDFLRLKENPDPALVAHLGVRVADRVKYSERGIHVRFVPLTEQLRGAYSDTLLYGGIISYDDPGLRKALHPVSAPKVDRSLLLAYARSRILP